MNKLQQKSSGIRIMPYERLDAWKVARVLTKEVYQASSTFPSAELYGITSQIQRATVSVAANIAEGSAKRGSREFRRYLDISLGSLSELSCLLTVAGDLSYLSPSDLTRLQNMRNRCGQLVWRLYEFHKRR